MNIKQKLYSLGFIAVLGVLTLLFTATHFATTTGDLNQATNLVSQLETRLLHLRRNEKDFLLRNNIKYLDKFESNVTLFLDLEKQLSVILEKHQLPSSYNLRQDLVSYQQGFKKLVFSYQKLGLSSKEGLKGTYNQAFDSAYSQASTKQALDLLLFNKAVYSGVYNFDLISSINSTELIDSSRQFIEQEKVIGLKYNEGLLGETRSLSHAVEEQFKAFSAAIHEENTQQLESLTFIKQLVSGVVLLIISGLIFQISRSINRQVQSLSNIISQISETNDIGIRANLPGNDELTSIGQHFNNLLDKIEALILGSQDKSKQLSGSTGNMHNQLEGVITQFHVQADHTATMATSVQEMVSTINEISESTTIAVEGVQQAANNAESGREVVRTTVQNISELSSTLANSQTSINSLNGHVDKIGGAVNIIQEIAEQTNLLALNAAIEAARAGEQGRGFAVVADEVRALASRTHQSTEEITKVVSAIQSQMSTVVGDIDKCNLQGQATLSDSELLDSSLSQIITDMSTIQANSERIASAIEEQGIVMNQVSESITELNGISDNNMHSAQECLLEVDSVSAQANDMDTAVAEFKTSHT
ncbi:methyl-accepting chemotaxis protein [Vibrio sp. 99-70-13A1]|uniref:methyl-accepting chemotaxis protein n=1 Tax=Vibrio sp. 99-70-13A1 TaxID=2607601 RepID=UPI0014935435|nr:methyl-accepting chemotaxis protein [Vibrio sp. 99-70-13A1]NOH99298.1 methyl-accepting chemotaxis protein [Vibrio sp. 99-70-13A1]